MKKPLTLVAEEHAVRVLDGDAEVARHVRSYDRRKIVGDARHIAALARDKRHAHDLRGRDRLRSACSHADALLDALAVRNEHLGGHTTRLLQLLDRYGAVELDRAIAEALSRGSPSAASVAHLLDQWARARKAPPPLDPVLFGWEALIIAGIIIGLCMAAYYVYLAVTTPGLTPYERGKLFGKALFNVVLSFIGVEFEGSNLLRFTQWGGLIPQAIRLVQRVGSLGEAIQLVRLVGSIRTALQLVEALGSVERVMQLVEEVGSASKLVSLIDRVGGVENLLRLIANPKIGDVSTLARLLENTKIGNIATLERLLANTKIADVATLERLLANAKITDAATLERLLNNAKIADVATLERLLANAKIADAATLERLLANAKIADVATLERLLANAQIADVATLERLLANAKIADVATLERLLANAKIADAATLERLLANAKIADAATLERLLSHAKLADAVQLEQQLLAKVDTAERLLRMLDMGNVPSGTKLLEWLTNAGGSTNSARLEGMLKLAAAKGGSVQKMCDVAAGSASEFQKMAEWADILKNVKPKPSYSPPSQVAKYGFNGADTPHFLDHTWEYVNIDARVNKSTTMWPQGMTHNRPPLRDDAAAASSDVASCA